MNLPHNVLVERLTQHSQALALPHGRRVGQPGHDVARRYLLQRMTKTDLRPFKGDSFELSYDLPHPNTKKPQKFTNLVAVIPGRDRSLPPILLGAHYDSVIDAPCVDDNATSVAHNLVLASHYVLHPLERDLIIAFFDAEEPPFYLGKTMGSRRFVKDHCKDIRFAAAIITDLVGHDATDSDLPIPGLVKTILPHLKKLVAVMG
jgi:aminopeptidase YwaD